MKNKKIESIKQNITQAIDLLKDNHPIRDDLACILQMDKDYFEKEIPVICFIPARSRQTHIFESSIQKLKDRMSIKILPGLDNIVDEIEREPLTLAKESIQTSDFVIILMQAFQLFPASLMEILRDLKKWHKPIGVIVTDLDRITDKEKFVEQKKKLLELEIGSFLKKLYFLSTKTSQKTGTVTPEDVLNDILIYVENYKDELRENSILRYTSMNLDNIKSKLNREIKSIRSYRRNITIERELLRGSFQVNEIVSRKVSMSLIELQEKIEKELNQLEWESLKNQILQIHGEIPKDDKINEVLKECLDAWKSEQLGPILRNFNEQILRTVKSTAVQIETEFGTYIYSMLKDSTFSILNNSINKVAENKNWYINTKNVAEDIPSNIEKIVNHLFAEHEANFVNNLVIKALRMIKVNKYNTEKSDQDNNTISSIRGNTLQKLNSIPDKIFEITMEKLISELYDNLRTEIERVIQNSKRKMQQTFMADIENYFTSISDIYVRMEEIIHEKYKMMKEISKIIEETIELCNKR